MRYLQGRFLLVLGVAVAVIAPAAAAAIGADTKRVESTVTLARSDAFHGHVSSARNACVGHRTVKLFNALAGTNGLVDRVKTDSDGEWSIPDTPETPDGDYYAKVARREEDRGGGRTLICRSDWSPTRHFE